MISEMALARLRPPNRVTLWDWADENIVLDAEYSAAPGPYSHARTPYMRGVWDALTDEVTREITFLKPTQIGGTQGCTVIPIAYWAAEDPGPGMVVMPTESDAREMKDRIDACFRESPNLRQFLPQAKGDDLRTQVRYGGTTVYYRGANSPRQLARVACRWVIVDEADKTPTSTAGGKETGAIRLAKHRVRTFERSKFVVSGTPSVRSAPMWQQWERSDQRRFYVPCPHCHAYQVLEFSRIRWPDGATADDVERDKSARYHCEQCDQAIEPYREKPAAIARGVWVARGGRIDRDGVVTGERRGEHAGFHLSALYSPWLTWSQIAVEHLRATTTQDRHDFTNGYLGMVYEEQVDRVDADALKAASGGYASGEVPDGVQLLTAGVDCGGRDLYYDVRGWGVGGETWLLEAGRIGANDLKAALLDFDTRVLAREWRCGDKRLDIRRVFIDSGYKPRTVARFCRARKRVCRAVVGVDENPGRSIVRLGSVEKTISGRTVGAPPVRVDINEVQDQIADTMHSGSKWHVPHDVPADWFRHLASEHAVMVKGKKRWHPLPGAGPNHWSDACRYAFAAGYTLGAWTIKDDIRRKPAKAQRSRKDALEPKTDQKQPPSVMMPVPKRKVRSQIDALFARANPRTGRRGFSARRGF